MRPTRSIRSAFGALASGAILSLVACNGSQTASPPGPGVIQGRYVRADGTALAGVAVAIGDQRTTTGADGSFRFTHVASPYDLVFDFGHAKIVYEGLTRPDPIVVEPEERVGISHQVIVTGRAPHASDLLTRIFAVGGVAHADWTIADPATGTYQLYASWSGASSERSATLYALRTRDLSIVDLARLPIHLQSGSAAKIEFPAAAFASLDKFAVQGSVRMPPYTQSYNIRMFMNLEGSDLLLWGLQGQNSVSTFAFEGPVIAGALFDVDVLTERANYSGTSYARVAQVPSQSGPLSLQLYDPPALSSPNDDAVLSSSAIGFSWSAGEGPGVYRFELQTSTSPTLVYTTRTDLSFDGIPALRGILEAGHGYFWRVFKLHAASSTDELVTVENRAANAWSVPSARRFLFQPL